MVTDEEYEAATRAGEEMLRTVPYAVSAQYDASRRRVVVLLSSGLELAFRPEDVPGLETATPDQLAEVEILGVGYGLHWESLDADVYVPSLLKGITGTKTRMAARRGGREAA